MIKKENLRFRIKHNNFGLHIGVECEEVGEGYAEASMKIGEDLTNPYRIAQGGSLVSLADATMALALVYLDEAVTTIDISYHFMDSIKEGGTAYCRAEVANEGKKIVTLKAEVSDGEKILGISTATYYRLGRPMLPEGWEEREK